MTDIARPDEEVDPVTDIEERELMSSDLPFELRMCPHLRQARQGAAVRRMRTWNGDDAWLVSGNTEIKELLTDERLGRSHPTPDARAQYAGIRPYDQVMSDDHDTADAIHAGVRAVLKPLFTSRRMLDLRPALTALVDRQADALVAHGSPADLCDDFSGRLIRLVFTELLGVPAGDQDRCVELMERAAEGDLGGLTTFLTELAAAKAAAPDDTMMARMAADGLTSDQIVQLSTLLHFVGYDATVKQINYALLLLTEEPAQRERLVANPDQLPAVIEEMLRLSGGVALPRYAREDIAIGGHTIRAGDLVLLDYTQANYDEDAFSAPTVFDAERSPNRHLTFGYGSWTCLGAPLARQVMHLVFDTLLTRIPTLRPAAPPDTTIGPLTGGLSPSLTVTW